MVLFRSPIIAVSHVISNLKAFRQEFALSTKFGLNIAEAFLQTERRQMLF
jgi:hypothetical protein